MDKTFPGGTRSTSVYNYYQDNRSTILLAENGKTSSSNPTKHLKVRYFFMTDWINQGEVNVA